MLSIDFRDLESVEAHLKDLHYPIDSTAPRETRVALANGALRDMYCCHSLSLRDIAELLDISVGCVRTHLEDSDILFRSRGGTNHYKDGKHCRQKETDKW
jgi:hypothetical protein